MAAQFDDALAKNISLAANISKVIVVAGRRQFDTFVVPAEAPKGEEDGWRFQSLESICNNSCEAKATWLFDPCRSEISLEYARDGLAVNTSLPTLDGKPLAFEFADVLSAFSQLGAPDEGRRLHEDMRFALIVNAALLFEDPSNPRNVDFQNVQAIERFSRAPDRSTILFLRASQTTTLPHTIVASPLVRTIHIPSASRDVRYRYVAKYGEVLAHQCATDIADLAEAVSNSTEDWTLHQVDALLKTAKQKAITRLHDLEELSRAVRIGASFSPWAGDQIHKDVAKAQAVLDGRVAGQPVAVSAVVSSLRKAITGLSAAHQSEGSEGPRAVLFFAGPTGTGKTEMAKAISKVVFGQEQLLRFDCGELRQEHAVARLIGAPPGYVGFERGGELTEGIRAKPNSVVLFDEIEKAHPRLLDTLLGVLDDGRLTSGQGETAYFGQSVLIFTSNLGMYEEIEDQAGRPSRRPRFNYETPFAEIQRKVRDAIRDEFVTGLGRPELLGRFGGAESIIVFDYLRDLHKVCQKFISNVGSTCRRLHGIDLSVDQTVIESVVSRTLSRPDALLLGGRGLKPELDRLLTDPLSDYIFQHPSSGGKRKVHAILDGEAVRFTTTSS